MRQFSFFLFVPLTLAACGSSPGKNIGSENGDGAQKNLPDASATLDANKAPDAALSPDLAMPPSDILASNRNRLLGTYFDYLKANVIQPQSNGLSGSNVSSVCELWKKLDPSAQSVFLTLTARMQGSLLGSDGSSMLFHILKVYRIAGGSGATANNPGSCGGEGNRMFMSMDLPLHDASRAANSHKGAKQANGKYDIADIQKDTAWRDSHDGAGPHKPFDMSDETNQGAPRGQTQFFADPNSNVAKAPLNRVDLVTLIDPLALEMDQDYDCVHNSNPLCTYVTYGPLCLPQAALAGTDVYAKSYGSFEPGWMPADCGGK